MAVQLLGLVLLICVGAVALVLRPLPTWPLPFEPQANSAPSARIATECSVPAARTASVWVAPAEADIQLVKAPILVGTDLAAVVPSPSWPLKFAPQAHSTPVLSMAMVCHLPAATKTQPVPLPMRVGTLRSILVPSPSWP